MKGALYLIEPSYVSGIRQDPTHNNQHVAICYIWSDYIYIYIFPEDSQIHMQMICPVASSRIVILNIIFLSMSYYVQSIYSGSLCHSWHSHFNAWWGHWVGVFLIWCLPSRHAPPSSAGSSWPPIILHPLTHHCFKRLLFLFTLTISLLLLFFIPVKKLTHLISLCF